MVIGVKPDMVHLMGDRGERRGTTLSPTAPIAIASNISSHVLKPSLSHVKRLKSFKYAQSLRKFCTTCNSTHLVVAIMQSLLSEDQLTFYHDYGYLVLRAKDHVLVDDPSTLKKWAEQVRTWPLDKGKWMPYFEVTASGDRQPMRTENFVDYHEEWKKLICGPGLASILRQLAGEVP